MKYKLLILLSFLILSCSENANPLSSDNDEIDGHINSSLNFAGADNSLDIVTWNIENFPKHKMTLEYVHEAIDSLNVDILALQEIESANALNELNQLLGDNWQSYKSYTSNYGNLAYLINTNSIQTFLSPYNVLNEESYNFASRTPYVLEFVYNTENFYLINVHLKCCDGSEERRRNANEALYNYIITSLNNENVLIVGDYNDLLIDDDNVFDIFLNNSENFQFTDYDIASGESAYWSFPSWPSHLDHILITNELFDNMIETQTVLIDNSLIEYFSTYEEYISDHRPVGISLYVAP